MTLAFVRLPHALHAASRLAAVAALALTTASATAAHAQQSVRSVDGYDPIIAQELALPMAEPLVAADEPEALAFREVAPREALFETGVASTYGMGDSFQGNLTACGQVFDTFVPQVAHKTLPCGTQVRVEDVETGKSVVVRVTDRGPYIPGRVVDLSWAAYRQLDPVAPGLLSVRVYLQP